MPTVPCPRCRTHRCRPKSETWSCAPRLRRFARRSGTFGSGLATSSGRSGARPSLDSSRWSWIATSSESAASGRSGKRTPGWSSRWARSPAPTATRPRCRRPDRCRRRIRSGARSAAAAAPSATSSRWASRRARRGSWCACPACPPGASRPRSRRSPRGQPGRSRRQVARGRADLRQAAPGTDPVVVDVTHSAHDRREQHVEVAAAAQRLVGGEPRPVGVCPSRVR